MVTDAEIQIGATAPAGRLTLPRVPDPADEKDVMREQLEYLIGHAGESATCGCSECARYNRVRSALLEIFSEPGPQQVHQLTATLPAAA